MYHVCSFTWHCSWFLVPWWNLCCWIFCHAKPAIGVKYILVWTDCLSRRKRSMRYPGTGRAHLGVYITVNWLLDKVEINKITGLQCFRLHNFCFCVKLTHASFTILFITLYTFFLLLWWCYAFEKYILLENFNLWLMSK